MLSTVLRTRPWFAIPPCRAPFLAGSVARHSARCTLTTLAFSRRSLSSLRSQNGQSLIGGSEPPSTEPAQAEIPKNAIYVANFPFWLEADTLKEKFEVFGSILQVSIQKTEGGHSRGYGHVYYANPTDAAAAIRALTKRPMYIGDRRIRACFPMRPPDRILGPRKQGRQLFIGNLPFVLEEYELRQKLETFGPVSDIRIGYTADGRARGFAHVDFVNADDAITAYESAKLEPLYLFDRILRLDYPQLKTAPRRIYQVFVGNLPFTYEAQVLREAFETFGDIAKIRRGYDETGRSLPYAHVEFLSEEAAEAAYHAAAKKEIYLFDRHLRVEYAKFLQGKDQSNDQVTSLYYEGFTKGGEKEIRQVFDDFQSRIVGVNCLKHRSGSKLTGQGFINFLTPEDALEAFETFHSKVDFSLEFATSKPPVYGRKRH